MNDDIAAKLEQRLVMSMFASRSDLYSESERQRREAAARIRQLEAERDAAYLRGLEDAADRLRIMGDMGGMEIVRAMKEQSNE